MTGQSIAHWTVIGKSSRTKPKRTFWLCTCKCGEVRHVNATDLRSGRSTNCGCVRKEAVGLINRTHSASDSRLYNIWSNMKARCLNEKNPAFRNYGGRGIAIASEWFVFSAFQTWANDTGYGPSLTIDRIENDSGYSPSNCRWTDRITQNRNTRRAKYMSDGKMAIEVADANGISLNTFRSRVSRGWSVDDAATRPTSL